MPEHVSLMARIPGRTSLALLLAGLGWNAVGPAAAADFPQGLVLHFAFDSAAALKSVPDQSGRGHNGKGVGLSWIAIGKKGGAAEFAGSNAFIEVAHSPGLATTQITLAVWFRTARAGEAEQMLFAKQPDAGYALSIAGGEGGGKGRLRFAVGGQECLGDSPVTDGAWHHVAATCDGKQLTLYLDGQLQKQRTPCPGVAAADPHLLAIGMDRSRPAKRAAFAGALDEAMIFSQALSAEQVQAVLAAAKQKFSEAEVKRRLNELKDLLDRGLILPEFYERKVKECEAAP